MSLRTFRPCPLLAPYVDAFWAHPLRVFFAARLLR
jgi:hypothetical protein